jgi:hypothetical protein
MLTNEQIKAKMERAFQPNRCVAEIHDYNRQLSFKVFAPDGAGLLEVPNLLLSNLRDERLLDAWLDDVRAQIASKAKAGRT